MAPDLFPFSPTESRAALNLRRWRSFLRSNGALRIGFFTAFLLTGLMVYVTFFSFHGASPTGISLHTSIQIP
jgi:hypothetical protein